jgi:hypothetical protein
MKRPVLLLAAASALFAFLSFSANAAPLTADQVNLDIGTPPIMVAKHTLTQRQSRLVRFYEHGSIGLGYDGMVKLRDASHLTLVQRQTAEKLIDQENPERNSLIFAIAEAHGGKEAIPAVREAQVKRWKAGWWIEDEKGNWIQKP